ncbi:hypothetical protein Pcinc_019140 [Petrolisthes cinctipes]|uniref:Uncharacterized protein n=1 Tax=Petrolisthes cinctipes TaxID=88211 RepID=A0AAE1FQK8_PETCI|nr:hypothetical protein Pcinc_019140 [Petrolisthes cinctipes]
MTGALSIVLTRWARSHWRPSTRRSSGDCPGAPSNSRLQHALTEATEAVGWVGAAVMAVTPVVAAAGLRVELAAHEHPVRRPVSQIQVPAAASLSFLRLCHIPLSRPYDKSLPRTYEDTPRAHGRLR